MTLSTMPDTAMVLAAGLGTRMRPLTDTRPKPLIEVNGTSLIDFTLDRFAAAGVSKAIVNVHYFAEMLEEHLRARTAPHIVVADERRQLLETGGGLKNAWPHFRDASAIFCTNTDAILINGDGPDPCQRLAQHWDGAAMDMLLLLVPKAQTSGYDGAGDFDFHHHSEIDFRAGAQADYVFTGLQILRPDVLEQSPQGPFSTKLLWQEARRKGRLHAVVHDGFWMHVGDPAGLYAAEQRLKKN